MRGPALVNSLQVYANVADAVFSRSNGSIPVAQAIHQAVLLRELRHSLEACAQQERWEEEDPYAT